MSLLRPAGSHAIDVELEHPPRAAIALRLAYMTCGARLLRSTIVSFASFLRTSKAAGDHQRTLHFRPSRFW